jgi:hypothetical protein
MTDGPQDAGRSEMIEVIADRLRTQFDLKGLPALSITTFFQG